MNVHYHVTSINQKIDAFLSLKRIVVAGVSRSMEGAASNIFRKLESTGHSIFAVNPNAESFEDHPCYPDVNSIPGGVDGVVIVTHPDITLQIVHQCQEAGVGMVWMHRSVDFIGGGSVSKMAVELCKQNGIASIPGACPMMFCEPVDFGHKCMRWMLWLSGRMPT